MHNLSSKILLFYVFNKDFSLERCVTKPCYHLLRRQNNPTLILTIMINKFEHARGNFN